MAGIDAFRFDGKRALVVGGASGMGAAAAALLQELGAEVIVMDYAPVTFSGTEAIQVDLRDKASIDAAVDACDGPIHALLSCAGVAPGAPGIEKVNFIGQRHLIERVIDEGKMPRGSSIVMISSIAGYAWEDELPELLEYLDTPDFETAVSWIEAHPEKARLDYSWSKQAVSAYAGRQAMPFLKRGIRINAVLPGTIDTKLARDSGWLEVQEGWRSELGVDAAPPEKVAHTLAFFCSDAASHINGSMLIIDGGFVNAGVTGAFKTDSPLSDRAHDESLIHERYRLLEATETSRRP